MDSPELHATEGPGNEVKGDHQPEHDTESEAFLSRTWRQAREDEMLILRDTGGPPTHPRDCSPAPLDRLILWHRQCGFLRLNHIRRTPPRRNLREALNGSPSQDVRTN